MKEILCLNKNCEYYFMNHCTDDGEILGLDEKGNCNNFKIIKDYKERINKQLSETIR